jgi:hypothetical protein
LCEDAATGSGRARREAAISCDDAICAAGTPSKPAHRAPIESRSIMSMPVPAFQQI